MSLFFYLFFGLVGLLLVLFAWSVRNLGKRGKTIADAGALEECGRGHVVHLPQIRQALAETDYFYLSQKAPAFVSRRIRQERRRVALAYLSALRADFQSLLRMAKIIARLSPEVVALHEFERLRLTVAFAWRYQMTRWKLWTGLAPMTQLDGLSNLVSGLSVRLEMAMQELGERAGAAAELASSMNRRGLDVG